MSGEVWLCMVLYFGKGWKDLVKPGWVQYEVTGGTQGCTGADHNTTLHDVASIRCVSYRKTIYEKIQVYNDFERKCIRKVFEIQKMLVVSLSIQGNHG